MADRRNLTDTLLKALKPAKPDKRYAISDTQTPGLKVRVTDTGAASFIVWRRFGGAANPSARLIGRVGEISLADARQKAREWVALARQGKDPALVNAARREEEARLQAAERAKAEGTFGRVIEAYYDHIAHQRRAAGVKADIERDLRPFWKDKLVTEITRKDVKDRIREIADGKGKKKPTHHQAHAALSNARTFFNWARDALDLGLEYVPTDGSPNSDAMLRYQRRSVWRCSQRTSQLQILPQQGPWPRPHAFNWMLPVRRLALRGYCCCIEAWLKRKNPRTCPLRRSHHILACTHFSNR